MKQQNSYRLSWVILLFLLYFAAFWKLDSWPIIQWDESRFAINSIEMLSEGRLLVPLYDGEPDFWNSKPPLTAISQSFWMAVLGPRELAVRLPSSLAAVFTILLLAGFGGKFLKNPALAILFAGILLVTRGYWSIHVARTGDADALLIWWEMVYILAYFAWLYSHRKGYLWIFALALLLAGLSKGIAAFLPLPAIGLFTLLTKEGRGGLKDYRLYLWGALTLALWGLYYFYREKVTPGYVDAVQFNEWGGRLLREEGTGQAVSRDWSFYLRHLAGDRYFPFIYFIPFTLLLGLISPTRISRHLTGYLMLVGICLLGIFSFSRTHHIWYIAPLYPIFAMINGLGLWELYQRIRQRIPAKGVAWVAISLGLLVGGFPFYSILQQNNRFDHVQAYESEGVLLKKIDQYVAPSDTLWVVKAVDHPYHWDQILFYQKAWKKRGGPFIQPIQKVERLKNGFYLSSEKGFFSQAKREASWKTLAGWQNCELIQVNKP